MNYQKTATVKIIMLIMAIALALTPTIAFADMMATDEFENSNANSTKNENTSILGELLDNQKSPQATSKSPLDNYGTMLIVTIIIGVAATVSVIILTKENKKVAPIQTISNIQAPQTFGSEQKVSFMPEKRQEISLCSSSSQRRTKSI